MNPNKKYFAFISYSRKDKRFVKLLHSALEHYRYPAEMIEAENKPYDKKFLRPIFKDTDDLACNDNSYWNDIKLCISNSRYLIVVCSVNSKASVQVTKEIDMFLQSHNNDTSKVLPVFIDSIISNFNVTIDSIIAERNCPIFNATHKLLNKDNISSFYHVVEFLIKVNFDTLFNRHILYEKYKMWRNILITLLISLVIIFSLIYALRKSNALAQFEKGTFPYSIVVGYNENFLMPMTKSLIDSLGSPYVFVLLPDNYDNLNNAVRISEYNNFIHSNYAVDTLNRFYVKKIGDHINSRRFWDVSRVIFTGKDSLYVFFDYANTVTSIKYVVDYKTNQDVYNGESRNAMVKDYISQFVHFARSELTNDSLKCRYNIGENLNDYIFFISDTLMLNQKLDSILICYQQ